MTALSSYPERGRVCVIVPAFNEEPRIGAVVRAVSEEMPLASVVVIDDGSSDRTAEEAEKACATVLRLPVHLGIGGAVQAGYRYAFRYDFDYAVQLDGDGQHNADEVRRILEPIQLGNADMVVGSRWLSRGTYVAPRGRRVGMRLLSRIASMSAGLTLTDTTSGFRAVGRRGIELFQDEYPADFPEVETLVLAAQKGLRLQEVGVRMNPRTSGQSSIAGAKSLYYMVRVITVLLVDNIGRRYRA